MHRHLVERACRHTRHRSPIRAESDPCWFVVVLCVDARWTGRCSRSNGVSAIDCWLCWLCCGRQNENPETAPAWTPSRPAPRRTHSACPRNGTAQHKTSERTNERITEGHRCRQGPRAAASHRTVPVSRWERHACPPSTPGRRDKPRREKHTGVRRPATGPPGTAHARTDGHCQRSTAAKEYECTHSTDAFGTDLGREFLVRSRRAAHRRKPHEHHEK